ncbi:MAG: adenylate kinase [Tepidisphaeraceae bacterium]|jgi:adenylate kinase family enzyme
MRRVVVVGSSCSGKTVMAESISRRLGLPHVELDSMVWLPGWSLPSDESLLTQVSQAIAPDAWVIDGVFPEHRNLVWSRADTVVWLNYPMSVVFMRALRRTLGRCITRQRLGDHNVETWRRTFFSRKSQLLWVIQSWRKRRRDYPKIFRRPEFSHLRFVQLRSPKQAQAWIEKLPAASMQPAPPASWQNYGSTISQVPA